MREKLTLNAMLLMNHWFDCLITALKCSLYDQYIKLCMCGYIQQHKGCSSISEGLSVATLLNTLQNLLLIQFSWGIPRKGLFLPLFFLPLPIAVVGEQGAAGVITGNYLSFL